MKAAAKRKLGSCRSAEVSPVADSVLRLDGVTKSFGTIDAVDKVSLDVRRGEILTLLGPSGCGKTTTLRIIVGLERATSGTVSFNDAPVDDKASGVFVPPDRRNMGMVFQSYAIWPHMTVFENVAYPLRVRRLPKSDIVTKVRNVLQLVGLSGFEERPATRLSGGQMQRIAVARALVFGPDILLMDEPFSNLDAKLREQMRTEVKLLQRQLGITVVFVTHDQSEALGLSDRIAVMNRGRMEQVGPPQALYADPLTPAVRDFLGRTIVLAGTLIDRGLNGALVELRDGTRIQLTGGERGERLEIGESCAVSIRPEFIAVTPAAAPRAKTGVLQPNVIAGQLRALLFLGDRYEASVTSKTAGDLTVILPATGNWAEGQEVAISLPPERLQLWPA